MVSHFKVEHPNDEVYMSRISPKMVDLIASPSRRVFTRINKGNSTHLQTICIFCEKMKTFPPHYFVAHIRSHTGEYANFCELCHRLCSTSSHCGASTTSTDDFDVYSEQMSAYRCIECNYVQTKRENIAGHLNQHHGLVGAIEKYIQEFQVFPAFRSLRNQSNPNTASVQGE